jgi:hypothetical protein
MAQMDQMKREMERAWIELRRYGRVIAQNTRQAKLQTAEAKERMDRRYLALQNLIYEKQHLELELAQCRDLAYAFGLWPCKVDAQNNLSRCAADSGIGILKDGDRSAACRGR